MKHKIKHPFRYIQILQTSLNHFSSINHRNKRIGSVSEIENPADLRSRKDDLKTVGARTNLHSGPTKDGSNTRGYDIRPEGPLGRCCRRPLFAATELITEILNFVAESRPGTQATYKQGNHNNIVSIFHNISYLSI